MSQLKRVFVIAALVVAAVTICGQAQGLDCNDASLHGKFALRATGRTLSGGDLILLARLKFDGIGNLAGTIYFRLPDGSNSSDTLSGTYSVASDCTVTDVWHFGSGAPDSNHVLMLFHRGNGFYILNTTVGAPVIISGEAKRQ